MEWRESVRYVCETTALQKEETLADLWYHDEVTWESLPPDLVAAGEQELARFKSMGVCSYVLREDAEKDADGVHVKTKWVRVNKGTAEHSQIRCRFVVQELALGERLDELFARTPSMSAVRLLLHSKQNGRCIMTMDVKTAFLYGVMRRKVYIELPRRDPWSTDGKWVGKLERALYGTRDAPRMWQQEVSDSLTKLGFQRSVFQPSVFVHQTRNLAFIIHVGRISCAVANVDDLLWMYDEMSKMYEMKKNVDQSDGRS